jgi:hypothetical protein
MQEYSGIYLVSRPMQGKTGGEHFAVVIYGQGPLNRHENGNCYPIVAEMIPTGLSVRWYEGGWWTIHGRVLPSEEPAALARLAMAREDNPDYALLVRNCEQFARWVTTGFWESKQLQTVGVVAAVAAFGIFLSRSDEQQRDAG